MTSRLTRRQFLPRAAGVAAAGAAGVAGYELRGGRAEGITGDPGNCDTADSAGTTSSAAQRFVTRPDLSPPAVTVTWPNGAGADTGSPRFIFLAPATYVPNGPIQSGLMIVDRQGRLVWFRPGGWPFDFSAQLYNGQQALTWWEGQVTNAHGLGAGNIADGTYRTVAAVRAGNGLTTDLHELVLTSVGTALVTAYERTTADLSSIGGSKSTEIWVGHAQEIDLATGAVKLDWRSLDHVGVEESYEPLPHHSDEPFDYFHINSVAETDDGNLLICARNTCGIYKIDRSTGRVIWRLNGRRSDFTLGAGAQFYWPHDARAHGHDAITVFDNAGPAKEKQSRALLLSLDTNAKRVELTRAFAHPAGFLSKTKGNAQLLPDGGMFVGWGDQPYFSEFAPDGALVLDGQLPFAVRSYRAYAADWVGKPTEPPRVAARANPAGGFLVYASWNGATEVAGWTVLAGSKRSSLAPVGSQVWSGFETAIAVNSIGPYFCAVAQDRHGSELGRSEVV